MFKSMTKEHKQTLLNLIVLALMALVLEVSSRFFYLGSLRKWGFLLIYILSAKEVLINAFKNLKEDLPWMRTSSWQLQLLRRF